jgi:hypothetical protein
MGWPGNMARKAKRPAKCSRAGIKKIVDQVFEVPDAKPGTPKWNAWERKLRKTWERVHACKLPKKAGIDGLSALGSRRKARTVYNPRVAGAKKRVTGPAPRGWVEEQSWLRPENLPMMDRATGRKLRRKLEREGRAGETLRVRWR